MRLARSAELWHMGEIGAGERVGPAEECRSVALGEEGRLGDKRCCLGTVTHSPGTSLTAAGVQAVRPSEEQACQPAFLQAVVPALLQAEVPALVQALQPALVQALEPALRLADGPVWEQAVEPAWAQVAAEQPVV